ncbi:MAG: ABC transporter ATP-binding protein [Hyphomonadaceae bacterium]
MSKTYASGFQALKPINLDIMRGEIFALLGPNGAGKTTLISMICGIVRLSSGQIVADGHDIVTDYKPARKKIGLVPQELHTDAFERVIDTVSFSRGLYGYPANPAHIEKSAARSLALGQAQREDHGALGRHEAARHDAKALSHEPKILFLDEPTAGVDVELRQDMWAMVQPAARAGRHHHPHHHRRGREEMADRVGVISKGELIVVEDKNTLMRKLGKKQLTLELPAPLAAVPEGLNGYTLELANNGNQLIYVCSTLVPTRHRHPGPVAPAERTRRRLQGSPHRAKLA